jgi:D-3-phosphoglycerate dehydrogenase
MLLRVDRAVDAHLLEPIGATVGTRTIRAVDFG